MFDLYVIYKHNIHIMFIQLSPKYLQKLNWVKNHSNKEK